MNHVFHTNGNYELRTADGGEILLNTGSSGVVRITGSLSVEGNEFIIDTDNLRVRDDIVTLNYRSPLENPSELNFDYSGFEINRGFNRGPASLLYSENDRSWSFAIKDLTGNLVFNESKLRTSGIVTDSSTNNGQLLLIGSGTGVVSVGDRSIGNDIIHYEDLVVDDDDVPNKKYVDRAILENSTFQIVNDDTRVVTFNGEAIPGVAPPAPYVTFPTQPEIAFIVDGRRKGLIDQSNVYLDGLTVYAITPPTTLAGDPQQPRTDIFSAIEGGEIIFDVTQESADLLIQTTGEGSLSLGNNRLKFSAISEPTQPLAGDNSVIVYGGTVGSGSTGLYSVSSTNRDELISKNRALLFSMIF